MKSFLILFLSFLTLAATFDADAARLGGGRSLGAQRSITPSPGPATNPVMPAPSTATPARPAAPATAPATGGASRWLGPIAGIAAGLGLAALFSHFGLSESFGSLLLLLLLVGTGIFIVRALFARKVAPAPTPYPFQQSSFEPSWSGGTTATGTGSRRFPPGFEPAPFVAEAKRQFYRLQEAYDRGDRSLLADVLTPQMQDEIGRDIAARGNHVPTEVVSLDGEVLDVSTEGDRHWASVRFTGQAREDGRATPEPFDEVWNLVKPVDGSSGWRLAGIQQSAHA
jgi:predicted lipid-binding transport protein (Tim44 family)